MFTIDVFVAIYCCIVNAVQYNEQVNVLFTVINVLSLL